MARKVKKNRGECSTSIKTQGDSKFQNSEFTSSAGIHKPKAITQNNNDLSLSMFHHSDMMENYYYFFMVTPCH
jgi:hypothetical protein